MALALALRVLPAYAVVFAHGIVNFQEPDAWFHVRTVHNLLAHFPRRSGFDPYVIFPRGQDIPTAPIWDYMLATPAWILGLGAPSAALTDAVAAWLPAILGALFPIPAFFLARRLFGRAAAAFAALWTAVGYGAFLWLTHLGLADHHAAEGLFAFLTLAGMCAAIDQQSSRLSWLAGIALGLFLGTRPAGIFVPATLVCLVVLEPLTAPVVCRAALAAAVVFLLAAGSLWAQYTWLSLAFTGLLAAAVLGLDTLAQRQAWPPWVRRAAPLALVALGAAAALLAKPHLLGSLWFEVRRVAGLEASSRIVATVQEMQPVYRAGARTGWPSILQELGIVWIFAMPVAPWLLLKRVRPAVRLLGLWSMVMGLAAIMQVRMTIYFLPVGYVLAGAACAWLVQYCRNAWRSVAAVALASLILGVNVPLAARAMHSDNGVSAGWLAAFQWLRAHTPDPIRDAGAWSRYYPAGSQTAADWGVAVWWDRGYELEQLAHRIPMANGTQAGEEDMARFYTETIPEAAVGWLRRSGARYVIVDPQAPWFSGEGHSRFPVQIRLLGRSMDGYMQTLAERHGGTETEPVAVYLPAYYQTMAARLYLSNGEAVDGSGPWVFETEPSTAGNGKPVDLMVASRHFASEAEAAVYMRERSGAHFTVGCLDAAKSCLPLPAVQGLKRVFSSNLLPLLPKVPITAVKIFEVVPE
jgi:dolichyl-diphosphooligosaccharide--protein glycosyltransferase